MTHLFSRTEVYDWVEKDEGLRKWWLASKLPKGDFIHNNRKAIESCINFKQADDYTCIKCGEKRWYCDQCGGPER